MGLYLSSVSHAVLTTDAFGSTGEPDGPPCKVGVAVTDIATGLYAHGAIMAALLSRQQTGQGVWIDCNLFESQVRQRTRIYTFRTARLVVLQLAGLANIASNYLIAGQGGSRHGTAHPSIVPYQVFPCKDGFIMIGAGNDKQVRMSAEEKTVEHRLTCISLIVQTLRGEDFRAP